LARRIVTPLHIALQIPETPTSEAESKIREGYLTCKVAVVDGKKANDRYEYVLQLFRA
jgi:hypothetical protein